MIQVFVFTTNHHLNVDDLRDINDTQPRSNAVLKLRWRHDCETDTEVTSMLMTLLSSLCALLMWTKVYYLVCFVYRIFFQSIKSVVICYFALNFNICLILSDLTFHFDI